MGLEEFAYTSDFHCVTTWSQFDIKRGSAAPFTLAELVKLKAEVTHVFYKSHDALAAHTWNGEPVPVEHGESARLIIPKIYSWTGVHWVNDITFLDRDILGFWEVRGYATASDRRAGDRFS